MHSNPVSLPAQRHASIETVARSEPLIIFQAPCVSPPATTMLISESSTIVIISSGWALRREADPRELGASEITAFLSWLAVKKNVAPSTQNQALSAVLFLYRAVLHQDLGQIEHVPHARVAARMPVVLSADEVRRVLKEWSGVSWINVDFERREITVRRGKGQKDRRVM